MNRKWSFILGLLGLAALALSLPIGLHVLGKARARAAFTPARPQDSSLLQARAAAEYGRLPLSFEENRGQTDPRVKFMARGGGYTVFLTDDESTTFRLSAPSGGSEKAGNLARLSSRANSPAAPPDAVVRLALAGSNPHAPVEGLELQAGRSNYFIGNDPSRWQRNVPHYARVKYRGVYPGVDLIYYGHQGHLESDYVLAPGADPSQIGLRIDGASSVKFDSEGNLLLATTAGDVVLQKPRTYQEIAGERREIATSYVRRGPRMVGLRVAPYDSREPLIIDPAMIYSTYLGGTGSDSANGIAVDSTKNAYVTGSTGSKDFPTTVFQKTFLSTVSGAHEIFVSKLAIDGSGLVYSTFIGGLDSSASDTSTAIALDSAGDAYITGTTGAKQFPTTTSAYQLQNLNSAGTAFMTKLAPDGASLLYSTYFGGGSGGIGLQNGSDAGRGIAVDSAGIAYLTGTTSSGNFPNTPGKAIQTTNPNQTATAFVSKINPSLIGTGSLVYSTFLGGTNFDQGNAIAVEPTSGIVYVTGFTGSTDFPVNGTVAAFQPALAVVGRANAFISKIDTTLSGTSGLLYSTYLGGTGSASSGDLGQAIAVDANANVFVAGLAASTNFPVSTGAVQTTNKNTTAGTNGFVARLDTTKSGAASRVYATYLGGAGNDQCRGIAVDSLQNAYVTGITNSSFLTFSTFITTGAPQAQIVGNQNAFAVVLNPTGSGVVFGTYWGGDGNTQGHAIALDTASPPAIYITGSDTSSNSSLIVSANAFQKARQAGNQISAFVAKFTTGAAAGNISVAPTTLNFGSLTVNTTSTPQAITLTNGSSSALTINSFPITGANASDFTVSRPTGTSACPAPGAGTVAAGVTCVLDVTFKPSTTAVESATLTLNDTNTSGTFSQTVNLSGSGTASGTPDFSVSVAPANATVPAGTAANFTLTVTSITGFNAAVAAACTGVPPPGTCVLTPTSVTPAANGTATIAGVISTTKRTMLPPSPLFRLPPGFPVWLWTLAGIAMALLAFWSATRRATMKLAFGFGLLALLSLTSCSGPIHGGTPVGAYTVTITATSGSLQHPVNFTLNVN